MARITDMMPMMLMMNMAKAKNGPNSRQQELLKVLGEQEEKIKKMLEEQNLKKEKEAAKGKNQALMERLFQIEESLLNQDQTRFSRQQNKKVDFTELMKGQQLYQRQLIDTLITINKKPKNTVQPTVYLPVPIRDPNLLPPEEDLGGPAPAQGAKPACRPQARRQDVRRHVAGRQERWWNLQTQSE
jgi:hypothetical protein